MKPKFLVLIFAVVGLIATLLPFVSVRFEGAGATPALVSALQSEVGNTSPNAWSFKAAWGAHPGASIGITLGLLLIFGAIMAATRVSRGLAIPTLVFTSIGLYLCSWAWGLASKEESVRQILIKSGPSVGYYVMLLSLVAITAIAARGIAKPEPKFA